MKLQQPDQDQSVVLNLSQIPDFNVCNCEKEINCNHEKDVLSFHTYRAFVCYANGIFTYWKHVQI